METAKKGVSWDIGGLGKSERSFLSFPNPNFHSSNNSIFSSNWDPGRRQAQFFQVN